MSETVQVALITAASGFLGAVMGVLGSWLLKWYELKAERERNYLETRRIAINNFANAKRNQMKEQTNFFALGKQEKQDFQKWEEACENANQAVTELLSLIQKKDAAVKKWINEMGFQALSLRPKQLSFPPTPDELKELGYADLFLGVGIQHLLAWHSEELSASDLRPFRLTENGESQWTKHW